MGVYACTHKAISTHALLAEGDEARVCSCARCLNFNPRPPCGGRRLHLVGNDDVGVISTHALLAEGDGAVR